MSPLAVLAVTLGAAEAARTLNANPPPGSLRLGERVLVNDGSCPAGQIKEITGGANMGTTGSSRQARCIPRK